MSLTNHSPKSESLRNKINVTAVFVTMNRSAIAVTCLKKLFKQTRPPERVIVFNNASTDNTLAALTSFQQGHPEFLTILDSPDNLGNAGGMERLMDRAFHEGADAVWILDDDSWPEIDALSELLQGELAADSVRSSRVIDPTTGYLSWPMQVTRGRSWGLLEADDPLPEGDCFRIRRSWLGALIPKSVYNAVGPINGKLFLRGEDEDYPRRIEKAGYQVFLLPKSVLHHPPAGRLHRWSALGQEIVLESGLSGDKLYYRLRNAWWIEKQNSGTLRAFFDALLYGAALVKWEGFSGKWTGIWAEAMKDMLSDRLGKRSDPK
ncbi:glycosyltransferase [Luteolibacter algae]|uniref:Glycosyltransferase n=1 Tax=Luteolibacter algae TaxID=454151 RepID=A0ABW5D840_9BACT